MPILYRGHIFFHIYRKALYFAHAHWGTKGLLLTILNPVTDSCCHYTKQCVCKPDQSISAGRGNADTAEPGTEKASNLVAEKCDAKQRAEFLRSKQVTGDSGGRRDCGTAGETKTDCKYKDSHKILRKKQE